ncbi:MAG: molecular chaperone [Alphaproteobacteria bacterium]|nr:molecular chaperone [Alphaproteobacteria bacterium]
MRYSLILALATALIVSLLGEPVYAQGVGNLTITPTRLVFEGRTRSNVITLVNNGSQAATYRVSVVEMRMREDGSFERIGEDMDQSAVRSARGMFRYAPRQIDLQPGQTQSIRILLRKPPELPEGEYRSHMLIQAIPKKGAGRSVESLGGSGDLSINLTIIPGVTLPIIVRHGDLSATATLSDFSLAPAGAGKSNPALSFRINRNGTRSVYGDLTATYYPSARNNGVVVSQIKLLAVYVPNAARAVVMRLILPEDAELSGGKIEVKFTTPPSEGAVEMARGEFPVPQ